MTNKKPTYHELEKKISDLEAKLNERVKEFNCISELSILSETKDNIVDILAQLPKILKNSWQFPEITEVKVTNNGDTYQTNNFKETSCVMHSNILVDGKIEGEIHIVYLKNNTEKADPFLEEEYNLLQIVSKRVGRIIERKKTQKRLNESELRFRTMFSEAPLGIALINSLTGKIYEVNQKFADIVGRTRTEMATIDWMSITHPDDVQEDLDNMALLNAGKINGFNMQKRYIKHDGSYVWINMTIAPVFTDDNQDPCHLCMIEDITEHKNTLELLKTSEEKYRSIFDNGLSAILIADDNGNYISANHAAAELIGYEAHELMKMNIGDIITTIKPGAAERYKKYLEKGEETGEFDFITKSGEKKIAIYRAVRIKPNFNLSMLFDITDRKKAEEALQENLKYLEKLNNSLGDAVFTVALSDRKIKYVNDSVKRIFGYKPKECINKSTSIIYPNIESYNEFGAKIVKAIKKKKEYLRTEHLFKRKNGEIFPAEITSTFLMENGRITEVISIIRDISQRKKNEQAIKESETKFRELFSQVNDAIFLYNPENFEIIEANNATSKIYGYSDEELIGMSCLKFSAEVDKSKTTNKKVKEKDSELVQLRHHVKKDGTLITVEIFVSKIFSDNKTLMFAVSKDITERIEAIQVKESEERFKNMFLRHNAIMLLIEPESGAIIDANNAAAKYYGYEKSRLCSLIIDDLNTLSPAQIAEERKNAINEKRNHFIFKHELANGEVRTVEVHSSPIKYQNKQILFSIIYDITERKKAEQDLIENEKKLNIWINNSPACTKIVDPDFNLQFMSDSGVRELKIDDITEFYGKPYPFHFYPDSFKVPMRNNLKKVKETGETITQEAAVFDIKGNELWYRSTLVPVYNNNDKLDYILVVSLEITDRIRNEQAIKENESRLGSLVSIHQKEYLNKSELLDLTLDESVRLTESKLGFICFYDSKTEQLSLHAWSEQAMKECSVESPQRVFDLKDTGLWGEAVRQKRPIIVNDYQAPNPLKKGTPKGHAKLNNTLILPVIYNNDIVALVAMANKKSDYTQNDILHLSLLMKNTWGILQKIEKEEFIKKQNNELTKLNHDKDKFMSILAHDLKNPFNNLLGFSQLLSNNIRIYDVDKIEKYVSVIYKTANNTFQLLEDILLWSRTQSGKIVFEPEKLNFKEVYQSIKEESLNRTTSKKISLESNVTTNLTLFTDINLLKTVLRNLISNAIKFTPQGGTITVNAKKAKNEITISVADTGVGIAKDILPGLFNMARANTTKGTNNEEGTGLGLQICKEFVEKMGGQIWLESEVGKGSVFYFTIPKQNN